jgi:N-acetyl-anhydromuramyl-L-alanine amidase AmpD
MPLPYDFIPSPNYDERPAGTTVSCIVLHSTVEPTTQGTVNIFLDDKRAGRVSAHFVVGKDGRVVQMVPIEKRAWHAGKSVFNGQNNVNHFSVGIEMVNLNDGNDPYPDEQYHAVAGIIRFLRSRFDIPDSSIVSHQQVATAAGRSDKTDPLGFDFTKVCQLARVTPAAATATRTQAKSRS